MIDKDNLKIAKNESLPLLPLRDVILFPRVPTSIFVGRDKSVKSVKFAKDNDKEVILVCQKTISEDYPSIDEIHSVGIKAEVLEYTQLTDSTFKLLVDGICRVKINSIIEQDEVSFVDFDDLKSTFEENEKLVFSIKDLITKFDNFYELRNDSKDKSEKVNLSEFTNLEEIADCVAYTIPIGIKAQQELLEELDLQVRIDKLILHIDQLIQVTLIDEKIRLTVKKQIEKNQKEYYLNEKLKAVQKELGKVNPDINDLDSLKNKIDSTKLSKSTSEKINQEFNKLKATPSMSSEASIIKSYIEWILKLPWGKQNTLNDDLTKASKILNSHHSGLKEVKERILEHLAVQKRIKNQTPQILCLVGPPGVGKTSLGKSIAEATNREFARVSLGGVRDESEIRGHRRTYIGSMPGTIIQKIVRSKSENPVILLDEIDKMGMDNRGDPASALLEVLDPGQNTAFNDHYLEIDYDLSKVMFICTANTYNIPEPLLDRMEIIYLPSYSDSEKVKIVEKYIAPKQIKKHGLKDKELHISPNAILEIARFYTKEAGVRNIERFISKICRKTVRQILKGKYKTVVVTSKNLHAYLGVRKYSEDDKNTQSQVGQIHGLAWTQYGGQLLTIEAIAYEGKGKHILTGKLGDTMKESIITSISLIKSMAQYFNLEIDKISNKDIHVHVPEGATPKDGPSAGVAMCCVIASALSHKKIDSNLAITGEVTLTGNILPIGGLKEKLIAAQRNGITRVLIPMGNKKDLEEISNQIKKNMLIIPVKTIKEVFTSVFV